MGEEAGLQFHYQKCIKLIRMQKITSASGLQKAIQELEAEQKRQAGLLKNQLSLTTDSLKPRNLLTAALKDLLSSPFVLMIGIDKIKSFAHQVIDRIIRKTPATPEPEKKQL